jgi:15-cis-phytoene synthase
MTTLAESYRACRALVRQANSNFAWTFRVLPAEKRRGMEALYAFARRTDDLGDSTEPVEIKCQRLTDWRQALLAALAGDASDPLLPALADTARRFAIPERHLLEIVDGVECDLTPVSYATFPDLRRYCYLVASAVGLACIPIWGFTSEAVFEPAIECGVAFQMTNILRDLREDAEQGRVYLPQEDLNHFGITKGDLLAGEDHPGLAELIEFEVARTRQCYEMAAATRRHLSPEGQRIFTLMYETYHSLFEELARRGPGILRERVRLTWQKKLAIAARSVFA